MSNNANIFTAWVLQDNRAGSDKQSLALANILQDVFKSSGKTLNIKLIYLNYNAFAKLPNFLLGSSLLGIKYKDRQKLLNNNPDIVIAASRRLAPVSAWIKEQQATNGKATKNIHIMRPQLKPNLFDLLLIPKHDNFKDNNNVIKTNAAIAYFNAELVTKQAELWEQKLKAQAKPPCISVFLGGSHKNGVFTGAAATRLAQQLNNLASNKYSLLISTSRRTNINALEALMRNINVPYYLYKYNKDDKGEANPYFGFVGLGKALVCTADSISMAAELCAAGKPVFVFEDEQLIAPKQLQVLHSLYANKVASKLELSMPQLSSTGQQVKQMAVDEGRLATSLEKWVDKTFV